jgi:hypothetical protein
MQTQYGFGFSVFRQPARRQRPAVSTNAAPTAAAAAAADAGGAPAAVGSGRSHLVPERAPVRRDALGEKSGPDRLDQVGGRQVIQQHRTVHRELPQPVRNAAQAPLGGDELGNAAGVHVRGGRRR